MTPSDDELERLLSDSFDRTARAAVPDRAVPPRPRFADPTNVPRRRVGRVLAPLAAAAAVVALVGGVVVLTHRSPSGTDTLGQQVPPTTSAAQQSPSPSSSALPAGTTAVHVRLGLSDESVVGVGMPVIARFSKKITDGRAFARATTLTVNGSAARAAWYFEDSAVSGYPIEAHLRMKGYWPADSKIHVSIPVHGLSGGGHFAFDDSLTLDFSTAAAQVVTVDDAAHRLVLSRNGHTVARYPVSLGASSTPTLRGIKVVMEKGADISMKGPGYYDPHVQWTQRLTYGGEYLHAAPWNTVNIANGVDSSNGCTNLTVHAAKALYSALRVGDVVSYPDATGAQMTLGDGYGDWNVSWTQWLTGGAVPTS